MINNAPPAEHENVVAISLAQVNQTPIVVASAIVADSQADMTQLATHPHSSDVSELTRRRVHNVDDITASGADAHREGGSSRSGHEPAGTTRTLTDTVVASRSSMSPPRPPIILDAAIGVLLVLVAALLIRRIF